MGQPPLGVTYQHSAGAAAFGLLDNQRAQLQSPRRGTKYAAAYGANKAASGLAGALFRASNQAAAALTAALATTYTGICLSNPAASPVNLSVKSVTAMLGPAP